MEDTHMRRRRREEAPQEAATGGGGRFSPDKAMGMQYARQPPAEKTSQLRQTALGVGWRVKSRGGGR